MNESIYKEHDLDQQLATRLVALHHALSNTLDLDTGLADARLPGLQSVLAQALDMILDVDAGLRHIAPIQHTTPQVAATPLIPLSDIPIIGGGSLDRFADDFCSRPIHVRLAARTWFPLQQLVVIRSIARLAFLALNIDHALDRGLADDHTCDLARNLTHALDHDYDRKLARDQNGALDHDLDLTLTLARTLARALNRALNHADAYARAHAHDLNRTLNRALNRTLKRALNREHDLARNLARSLAHAHTLGLNLGHQDRIRFIHELIAIVDRLEQTATNMTGANLAEVDLHGIHLEGLRWSTTTRWPADWADQIRQNSVEVQPGIYEIRYGNVDAAPWRCTNSLSQASQCSSEVGLAWGGEVWGWVRFGVPVRWTPEDVDEGSAVCSPVAGFKWRTANRKQAPRYEPLPPAGVARKAGHGLAEQGDTTTH